MNSVFLSSWQVPRLGYKGHHSFRELLQSLSCSARAYKSQSSVLYQRSIVTQPRSNGARIPPILGRSKSSHTITRPFHTSLTTASPRARGSAKTSSERAPTRRRNTSVGLSENAIRKVFRGALSRPEGNDLLSKLQKNREDGNLDAPFDDYAPELKEAGLTYLRNTYPMDEEAAIIARIDRELDHEFRPPQTATQYSPNQQSELEKIRKENIKRNEREEARAAKEKAREEAQSTQDQRRASTTPSHQASRREGSKVARELTEKPTEQQKPLRKFKDLLDPDREPPEPPQWVKDLRKRATPAKIPHLSYRARLVPTGLFTLAVILLSIWFADTYVPPSQKARMFPDTPPAAATLQTIIGINITIFLIWRIPFMWQIMNKYFINLTLLPRPSQMLLAAFSHQDAPHLATNMLLLWFFGVHLHDEIGRGPFLALTLSAAVMSSYTTLVLHTFKWYFFTAGCGASGIVTAYIAASCTLNEGLMVKFPFLSSDVTDWINSAVILALIVVQELLRFKEKGIFSAKFFQQGGYAVDYVGHLAGYATGFAAAMLIRQHDPRWRDLERRSFWYKSERGLRAKVKNRNLRTESSETLMPKETNQETKRKEDLKTHEERISQKKAVVDWQTSASGGYQP